MGIDARILLRLKGEKPTETDISRWSWELSKAVGPKHFFTTDGLAPEDYKAKDAAWTAAFQGHRLYQLYETANWEYRKEYRADIVADIGEHDFKERQRAIELTTDWSEEGGEGEGEYPAPGDGKIYHQDGPDIRAAEGEWLLTVNLWSRWYGIGYERGDLLTICAIAEWVEANIPNCEVWYGGDSSGVCAEPFGREARDALKRHFYSESGRDYFAHARPGTFPTPAPCSLCIPEEPRFNQHGFGQNFIAVNCGGCGKSFESHDNGKTWQLNEKD